MKHRRLFLSFFMVLILLSLACMMLMIRSSAIFPYLGVVDTTSDGTSDAPPVEQSEEVVELETFIAECLEVDRFELRLVSLDTGWNCEEPIKDVLVIGGYVTVDGDRSPWVKWYQITEDFHDHLAEHQYYVRAQGPIESLQPGMANIIRAYVQYGKEWSR